MPREHLPPETFRLPVDRQREGYYSDAYFVLTKQLLEDADHHPRVLMHESDLIEPHETVLTIEGDYSLFAHLETVYLGVLARRTLIMRNVCEVVAAAGKQILYFPARHDHWLVQTGDGWAAHVAGAIGVSTEAQASWWGGRGMGTVPHALIAAYGGDTVRAATAFADRFADELRVTVLVDFDTRPATRCAQRCCRASTACTRSRSCRAARRWATRSTCPTRIAT